MKSRLMCRAACVFASSLILVSAGTRSGRCSTPQIWNPLAEGLEYRELEVTNEHRFQTGVMSAHWGHHLGRLVRTRTTGLWFVDDTGNDVYVTPRARYYQLVDDTAWVWRASITNRGTVQQNTASVAVGDTIYTYGVDVSSPAIVENWLDTRTLNSGKRTVRYVLSNTNYIGAAVTPKGGRLVWWTKVVDGGGPAWWYYMWIEPGESLWRSTVTSDVPANDFSYVLISWLNDSTFYAAGEAIGGTLPNWTYDLGVGKVILGKPITDFVKLQGKNNTANDLWVNPANGDIHILGDGSNRTNYYYCAAGAPWPDSGNALTNPQTVYRGTRFVDAPDGFLYLFLSTPTGLKFKRIARSAISGRIEFDSLATHDVDNKPGFNYIFALFPEIKTYQTTPVGGINFAYPGNDYDYGHIIRYINVRGQRTLSVPVPRPEDAVPRLNQNAPNPFNPGTTIRFSLPRSTFAALTVYDVHGRPVRSLASQTFAEGTHDVHWDGRDASGREVASGTYIARLATPQGVTVRRMTLAR